MNRSPDAGGARRRGPWRSGFEIPLRFGDAFPDLPDVVAWMAAGATVGFITLSGIGVAVGAGGGLLAHGFRSR